MRKYEKYLIESNRYIGKDLAKESGVIRVHVGHKDYITYGKSIYRVFVTLMMQLKQGYAPNQKLRSEFSLVGEEHISFEILEFVGEEKIREKANEYISKLKPTLNYHKNPEGFTEQHRYNMSLSKMGEKHNRAKLTEEQAIEIKLLSQRTNLKSTEIAEMYSISPEQVRKIKTGRAWRHLKV